MKLEQNVQAFLRRERGRFFCADCIGANVNFTHGALQAAIARLAADPVFQVLHNGSCAVCRQEGKMVLRWREPA